MGLFDRRNLFELTHPDFPNERLVACRNPELAERRRHKRRALLEATCKELEKVCRMVERRRLQGKEDIRATVKKLLNKYKVGKYYRLDIRDDGFDFELDETTMAADASRLANGNSELANKRLQRWKRHMGTIVKQLERIRQRIGRGQLHGKDKIGVRVGKVLNKYKVGKHFKLDIRDDRFSFEIDDTKVTTEAALDGIYVIRTSLAEQRMKTDDTVRSYKFADPGREGVSFLQEHGPKGAADSSPARKPSPGAHLLVHAGLLRPVAHDGGLAPASIL